MAIANTRLITALREAADGVESGKMRYFWMSPSQCNCGVVAQILLGVNADGLALRRLDDKSLVAGCWRNNESQLCSVTLLPMESVIRSLASAGFRGGDLYDLEILGNEKIRKRAGLSAYAHYEIKENFVRYARAWADLLEEERDALDPAVVTSEPVRAVEGVLA